MLWLLWAALACSPGPTARETPPAERTVAPRKDFPRIPFVKKELRLPPSGAHLVLEDVELETRFVSAARVSDLDGDGGAELLIHGGEPERTWIVPSRAAGWMTLDDAVAAGRGEWLDVGDQDGDGVHDLASALGHEQGEVISGAAAIGDIDALPRIARFAFPGGRPHAVGDVTGDGGADLATGGGYLEPLVFLEGPVGDGLPPRRFASYTSVSDEFAEAHEATDIDGDGIPDLSVTRAYVNDEVAEVDCHDEWFLGPIPEGAALVPADADISRRSGNLSANPCPRVDVGDVDGDGGVDLVTFGSIFRQILVYSGPFVSSLGEPIARLDHDDFVRHDLLGDVDGDGADEIVVSVEQSGEAVVGLWPGPPAGQLDPADLDVVARRAGARFWTYATVGDVDRDGLDDALLALRAGNGPLELWVWTDW